MTTKEIIQAELENLAEEDLTELLGVIKELARAKDEAARAKPGLLSQLRRVQIDAPEDFAANLDLYLSGEKRLGSDEGLP
jgi:hypothetical protein